jgi:uncharacterized membrane protein YvbJ
MNQNLPVNSRPPATNQQGQVPPVAQRPNFRQVAKGLFDKIYKNKKIFWLITSLFSIIILIIVAGVIFKLTSNKSAVVQPKTSPTPAVVVTDTQDENKEPLDLAKEELDNLRKKINEFDINQKRLSPPAINFEISF